MTEPSPSAPPGDGSPEPSDSWRRERQDFGSTAPGARGLLAREFAELALSLYGAETLEAVLARIAEAASVVVPGCDAASITLATPNGPTTPAATAESAAAFDAAQYDAGQGPCLDAIDDVIVVVEDGNFDRWPRLDVSGDPHFSSVVSCGFLLPNREPIGALNLYSTTRASFDTDAQQVALILAAHATVAVAVAVERDAAGRVEADLREAMLTRDVIGQAQGILMERLKLTPGDAFDVLRRASQSLNRKLRDIAEQLAHTGELTTGAPGTLNAVRIADALTLILSRAHDLPPDQLPDLGEDAAAASGVHAVRIYLADYAHRQLRPFSQPSTIEPFDIDGTNGGRAFILGETVELERDGTVTLWVPLVNGIERIGVVEFELDRIDDDRRGTLVQIASLLASEVVTRGQYSDTFAQAQRSRPLTLAAELQRGLLKPVSFETDAVSVAAMLEPAYRSAGDLYDYAYNNGDLHAALFDAVGHDVHSSLVATLIVGTYQWARRQNLGLSEVAAAIDEAIHEHFPHSDFGTGILLTLDVKTGVLRSINNGHPPPILAREGNVVGPLLGDSGPPLGLRGTLGLGSVEISEAALQPGDRVLLYTDGITEEPIGDDGEPFGIERLHDFLQRALASGHADAEVLRRLAHAITDFPGSLRDDATALLIHWHPDGGAHSRP